MPSFDRHADTNTARERVFPYALAVLPYALAVLLLTVLVWAGASVPALSQTGMLPRPLEGRVPPEASEAPVESLAVAPVDSVFADSLAVAPVDSVFADSLAVTPVDSVFADSLAVAPVDSAPVDSLEVAGADTVVAAPPDPYAIGIAISRKSDGQFLRPWTAFESGRWWTERRANRAVRTGALSLPLTRETTYDLDTGTVRVDFVSTDGIRFPAYAAPLDEFTTIVTTESRDEMWKTTFRRDLGRVGPEDVGGLLDIDIPMPLPGPFVRAIGPGANLKVRGSERITFGGQTSYTVEALDSEAGPPSRWPQLDMEQQLTVNLEGTIGRKIHVYVDHRSGGDAFGTGKANQIRVHYDGDEDEIIQKIELGEVNLSLPGTEFVSYSGSAEGLFGAKLTAKMGRFDFVSIASKEEGKSAGAGFSGTSESDSLQINDITYKARTFFAIDTDALRYSNAELSIQDVRVFIDDRNGGNDIETGAVPGRAYLEDPVGAVPPAAGPSQRGVFDELVELEDYLFDYQSGVIEFLYPINAGEVLAVSYERFDGYTVGGADGDSLRLKMIKREDRVVGTEWEPTRRYELKHIYDLGNDEIPEEGFELAIYKRTPSGEVQDSENGVPFTQILGIDTHGLGGDPTPDGLVDLEWIDFDKGYLIFPHMTPFCPDYDTTDFYYAPGGGPDPVYVADELEEKNCSIYSEEVFEPDDDIYYLEAEYNSPQTTFYLGHINLIENSEVVRLNGVRLERGVDYTIYYPAGQLTLLTEEAKQPDARVTVDFDYKPFGIGGEKTLLGARGVYNWSDNVKIGTTWMYQSKGTPEDNPRLGEEPSRTVVGDVNMSARFEPEFMTWLADAVPFVDTDARSTLTVAAEAALCIPDPNTKGFVAIDDMEGTENVSALGVTRRLWIPSSVPVEPMGMTAADRMDIDWYNPDRKVREGDLHPELPSEEANDTHTVLQIDYDADASGSWAGLMRLLSKTGNDYSKYQFVDLWVHDNGYRQGAVHIDLGTISEDFYPLADPNGELDSEDVDRNGFDYYEDTGLDITEGEDGTGVPGDDGDDDYSFSYGSDDYTEINGTEGNERLDTEDLNGNWYLDSDSKYWELSFDLSDTTYLIQDNSEIDADNHWRLYRIPLDEALSVGGMTDWTVVKSARLWVEGLPVGGDPIMIGGVDVVGSQWEPDRIRDIDGVIVPEDELGDESFRVTSKNTKEDLDYDPPFDPGVDNDTNLPKREQSLVLLFDELGSGHSASARQIFYADQDYTGYQSIEFYVHGDEDVEEGTRFFLRVGADSLNYYEYSFEVRPGWLQRAGSGVNRLTVPFTGFTDLKLAEFATADTASALGATEGMLNEEFKRIGWPSLSRVRRLMLGVRNGNLDDPLSAVTGEIWIDDIRLTDVRKDIGLAERVTVGAKFADLLDVDFDLRHVDGDFHTLKQTSGSGQDNLTYNFTGTLNADRFVSGLGISTPVNVSWKRSETRPKFSSGSDIVLDDQQSQEEKTINVDRSAAISLSRKRQSPDFWTHLLVDGLSLRGSVAGHEKLSPTKADTSRTIRGRASYKYAPEKSGIPLFGETRIFLKPTSIRFNTDVYLINSRNYDIDSDGVQTRRSETFDKKMSGDANIDFQFLENLRTTHTVGFKRDLSQIYRPWAGLNIGRETERRYANSVSFNPKFGQWLSPQYSFSSSFTDNHGPEVQRTGDPPGVRDIRSQSNHQLRASFDLKKLFGAGPSNARSSGGSRNRGRVEEDPRRSRGSRTQRDEETAPGDPESGDGPEPGEEPGDSEILADGAPPRNEGEAPPEGGTRTPVGEEEQETEGEGPGLSVLVDPILSFIRKMDALDGRYSVKRNSRFDRVPYDEMPGWGYRLGIADAEDADDRTVETSYDAGTGVKLTSQIRIKGDYKHTMTSRWYKSAVSESLDLVTQTESMNETTKGTFSWSGLERVGPLSGMFKSVRARSGAEYRRSYSGPVGEPTSRGNSLSFSPIVSLDATLTNGLTGSFSWDRKRANTYSLSGVGSVTEDVTSSMSLTMNYRFSAPQGLKLPFFGQKLKFESNLDTSLTFRTSAKQSRTAQTEALLVTVEPSSATKEYSIVADATYSFSRSVSGGLQISFAQSRDEKRDQTRRTIGVHLSAEFKF